MIEFVLAILGLAFGSFVTALTWRLHEGKDFVRGRSQCEHCGHQLAAQDLIPLVSWLWLRGKCRYCGRPISWQNPAIEAGMSVLFVGSYIFWPVELASVLSWASFVIWLVYMVLLLALVVYDFRWMLLPNKLVFPLMGLGLIDVVLRLAVTNNLTPQAYVLHVVLGAAALGGFYWLLHTVSKGKWVGYGDVKLGAFIGLVLGWQQALLALFLANIIGFLVVAPGLATRKLTPKSRVPFGPFLIVAFIIAGLFGQQLIDWYLSFILLR